MKLLALIFLIIFLLFFLFGKITVEGTQRITIWERAGVCVLAAGVMTVIVGLPILGIVYLLR